MSASWTRIAIWTRLVTWSLSKTRETCAFTVGTDRWRRAAISALLSPLPTSRATSSSRSVSARSASRAEATRSSPVSRRSRSMRVRVAVGESIGSPATTVRIAVTISGGGVSLSRKPSAPAASAPTTCSSASKVVRTMTRGGWGRRCSSRVASSPPSTGIRMSISTTSGRSLAVSAIATRPSGASPTTSRSGWPPSIRVRAERTSGSSSTTSTRVMSATVSTRGARSRRRRAGAPASRPAARRAPRARPGRGRCPGSWSGRSRAGCAAARRHHPPGRR